MINSKALICVSHFDDEVLGFSSVIENFEEVEVLIACGCDTRKEVSKKLEENLKIKYNIMDYNPFELNQVRNDVFNSHITEIIQKVNPDYIFTHIKDLHPDHIALNEAVNVATRSYKNNFLGVFEGSVDNFTLENSNNFYLGSNNKDIFLNYYKDYINSKQLKSVLKFNEYLSTRANMQETFIEVFKVNYLKSLINLINFV